MNRVVTVHVINEAPHWSDQYAPSKGFDEMQKWLDDLKVQVPAEYQSSARFEWEGDSPYDVGRGTLSVTYTRPETPEETEQRERQEKQDIMSRKRALELQLTRVQQELDRL